MEQKFLEIYLNKILQDAIKVIDDVKVKLSELEKINYSFYDKNIQANINTIIEEIRVLVERVEDNPKLLSKVRKFFKVYLARVVEITKDFSETTDITEDIKDRYKWLLEDLKNTITEQKSMIEKKDLTGLEIQIEALSKQLKEEGV